MTKTFMLCTYGAEIRDIRISEYKGDLNHPYIVERILMSLGYEEEDACESAPDFCRGEVTDALLSALETSEESIRNHYVAVIYGYGKDHPDMVWEIGIFE